MLNNKVAPSSGSWRASLFSAGLFVLACVFFVRARAYSANDVSRLASVEALVERGTWAINASPFSATIDKIRVGDSYFSDKPPLLSFVGAGVYAVLRRGAGLTLQAQGCRPASASSRCRALGEPDSADWAYVLLTLLLVIAAGGAIVALVCHYAQRLGYSPGFALGFALTLGLGTGLWPYSTVFTNHVPAAGAVLAAFYVLLTRPFGDRTTLAWAGAWATLGMLLDLSAGVFLMVLALYVGLMYRHRVIWFALGALPLLGLGMWLDYQIVGNIFPPQMYAAGYAFAGSAFSAGVAGNRPPADVGQYAFDLLLGERGLLGYFPIIGLYGIGLAAVVTSKAQTRALRGLAGLTIVALGAYFSYFLLSTDNFGGYAYSPRWLLVPVPVVAMWSLHVKALYQGGRRRMAVGALALLSVLGGYRGAVDVWQAAWPVWRVALAPYGTTPETPAVAISGYSFFDNVPATLRPGWPPNNIKARSFDAGQGLVIPAQRPAWWFISETTPLATALAEPLGLRVPGPMALYADLQPVVRKWLTTFTTRANETPPGQPPAEVLLPVYFNQEIALQAYQWQRQANKLTLVTSWLVDQPVPAGTRRSIVLNLVDASGKSVQQATSIAVDLDNLQSGDEWLQVHELTVDGLAAGTYTLRLGVYDPERGEWLMTWGGAPELEFVPPPAGALKATAQRAGQRRRRACLVCRLFGAGALAVVQRRFGNGG